MKRSLQNGFRLLMALVLAGLAPGFEFYAAANDVFVGGNAVPGVNVVPVVVVPAAGPGSVLPQSGSISAADNLRMQGIGSALPGSVASGQMGNQASLGAVQGVPAAQVSGRAGRETEHLPSIQEAYSYALESAAQPIVPGAVSNVITIREAAPVQGNGAMGSVLKGVQGLEAIQKSPEPASSESFATFGTSAFERAVYGTEVSQKGNSAVVVAKYNGMGGIEKGRIQDAPNASRPLFTTNGIANANIPLPKEKLNGKDSSGLSPPVPAGKLSLQAYEYPFLSSLKLQAARVLHYGFYAASFATLAVGLGIPGALVPLAVLAGGALKAFSMHKAASRSNNIQAKLQQNARPDSQADAALTAISQKLLSRIGLAADKQMPLLNVIHGEEGAWSFGYGIGPDSNLTLGSDTIERSQHQTASVVAHEMGHLFLKDSRITRWLRMRDVTYKLLAAFFGLSAAAGAAFDWAFQAIAHTVFGMVPGWLFISPALAAVSIPLAALGLFFGYAVTREKEYRADHFAGWLATPKGIADFLEAAILPLDPVFPNTFMGKIARFVSFHIVSDYPLTGSRIRRLRAMQGMSGSGQQSAVSGQSAVGDNRDVPATGPGTGNGVYGKAGRVDRDERAAIVSRLDAEVKKRFQMLRETPGALREGDLLHSASEGSLQGILKDGYIRPSVGKNADYGEGVYVQTVTRRDLEKLQAGNMTGLYAMTVHGRADAYYNSGFRTASYPVLLKIVGKRTAGGGPNGDFIKGAVSIENVMVFDFYTRRWIPAVQYRSIQ